MEGPSRGRLDARRGVPGEPNRGGVRGRGQEVPEGHVWSKVSRRETLSGECVTCFSVLVLSMVRVLPGFGIHCMVERSCGRFLENYCSWEEWVLVSEICGRVVTPFECDMEAMIRGFCRD